MIKIDTNDIKNLGSKFDKILKVELDKASNIISNKLILHMKSNHRFDSKTGRLESAIKIKGSISKGLEVYIDESIANYGKYIVNGHKSWKSDKFLTNALKANYKFIHETINLAVNKAVIKLNRR